MTIGESPAWLKGRLMGAGMRPISNVVDITNYVMLALGSPLHAYDADTLRGGIVVRRAQPREKLVTLDGTSRELDPADLVIADHERPIGLAGVMGGENTEVSASTTSVVLETANFEPLTVIRSGERHRMRSEAQTRWEKGVDPEAAALAATYASQLLAELAGARWTGETELRAEPARAAGDRLPPAVRDETVGLEIAEDEQRERLGRLGFQVTGDWTRHRPDLARARRAPRHRRRRGGRRGSASRMSPRRSRDGRRCTAGSRTSSACAASSLTCSSAPGCTRRTPTRCSTAIPIRTHSSCPSRSRRSSASCART